MASKTGASTAYLEYKFNSADAPHTDRYLTPCILKLIGESNLGMRVLDVGCGNGHLLAQLARRFGWTSVGIDLSEQGIAIARKNYPDVRWEVLPADSDTLNNLNEKPFDLVISTEVVEHLYDPKSYAKGCFSALRRGGRFVCSTPYHGYLKNLAIAATNHFDRHVSPLWDCGHIKFWSRATLSQLLTESGFVNLQFRGAGRVPWLWKSMVMSGDRPQ